MTGSIDYTVEEFNLHGECVSLEMEVEYSYTPGTPDVWYLRNGDPGYPGDPPEVDWKATVKAVVFDDGVERRGPGFYVISTAQEAFDATLQTHQAAELMERIDAACTEDAQSHDSGCDYVPPDDYEGVDEND